MIVIYQTIEIHLFESGEYYEYYFNVDEILRVVEGNLSKALKTAQQEVDKMLQEYEFTMIGYDPEMWYDPYPDVEF